MEETGDPTALSEAAIRMQDAEYGVAAVRMADASGMDMALESAIDLLTPLGLKSLKKVEEAADSETGVKAKKSYLKKKQQAKMAATEANEKAVRKYTSNLPLLVMSRSLLTDCLCVPHRPGRVRRDGSGNA
jgi:hypothetical protein